MEKNVNYDSILLEIESMKENAELFFGDKKNSVAGKRIRSNAQNIIKFCKELRKDISVIKTFRKSTKS